MTQIIKIPSITELVSESEDSYKENALMVLLNQEPPKTWLIEHPLLKGHMYLPIERVEYMLTRIFTKWWVEIKSTNLFANSIGVVVRVYVINPITGKEEWQEGAGASAIQTEKGSGAMDWNKAKSAGVQMALPIAESLAIKDAAEKWGKIFGKDLNRKTIISYDSLLKTKVDYETVSELFEIKKDGLSKVDLANAKRILTNKEENSYGKLFNQLKTL